MRAPGGVAVAVRRPDGTLALRDAPLPKPLRSPIWKLPGLRGIATLGEALSLGYSALQWSADQQEQAPSESSKGASASGTLLAALSGLALFAAGDAEEPSGGSSASAGSRGAMILSTLLALGLFIALPQMLTAGVSWLTGIPLDVHTFAFHAITGGFKLLILLGYLTLIARIPEIRRVFQYHGAEHKTIHAYEADLPLTVENVRAQSTRHPRCGTTFLVVVVIVSVLLGSVLTPLLIPASLTGLAGQAATLALRIAILPLIAALSYELQRLGARYCTTGPLQVLLWPGFFFQGITTREPDDDQIEVAIASMQAAFARAAESAADQPVRVRVFADLPEAQEALAVA